MFGAIQYASGNDLRSTLTDTDKAASSGVNRTAKGDRASLITTQNEQSQTLSFRVQGLSDTSVLLRMGVALGYMANRGSAAADDDTDETGAPDDTAGD